MINVYHSVCCLQIAPGYTNILQFSWCQPHARAFGYAKRTSAPSTPSNPLSTPSVLLTLLLHCRLPQPRRYCCRCRRASQGCHTTSKLSLTHPAHSARLSPQLLFYLWLHTLSLATKRLFPSKGLALLRHCAHRLSGPQPIVGSRECWEWTLAWSSTYSIGGRFSGLSVSH
jgi:hypothetical protein